MSPRFTTDPAREGALHEVTGIYIRAKNAEDRWINADIAELDLASLMNFLRGRLDEGERGNPWAESCVAIMLGHDMNALDDQLEREVNGVSQ